MYLKKQFKKHSAKKFIYETNTQITHSLLQLPVWPIHSGNLVNNHKKNKYKIGRPYGILKS